MRSIRYTLTYHLGCRIAWQCNDGAHVIWSFVLRKSNERKLLLTASVKCHYVCKIPHMSQISSIHESTFTLVWRSFISISISLSNHVDICVDLVQIHTDICVDLVQGFRYFHIWIDHRPWKVNPSFHGICVHQTKNLRLKVLQWVSSLLMLFYYSCVAFAKHQISS